MSWGWRGTGKGSAGPLPCPPPPKGGFSPPPAHLEEGGVGVGGQVGELQVALHHLAALVEVPQGLVVALGAGGTQQLHVGPCADCGDGAGVQRVPLRPARPRPPRGNRAGGGTGLRRKRRGSGGGRLSPGLLPTASDGLPGSPLPRHAAKLLLLWHPSPHEGQPGADVAPCPRWASGAAGGRDPRPCRAGGRSGGRGQECSAYAGGGATPRQDPIVERRWLPEPGWPHPAGGYWPGGTIPGASGRVGGCRVGAPGRAGESRRRVARGPRPPAPGRNRLFRSGVFGEQR